MHKVPLHTILGRKESKCHQQVHIKLWINYFYNRSSEPHFANHLLAKEWGHMLPASSTININQWLEPYTLSPKSKYCNVHCQEHIWPSCDAEEIDVIDGRSACVSSHDHPGGQGTSRAPASPDLTAIPETCLLHFCNSKTPTTLKKKKNHNKQD